MKKTRKSISLLLSVIMLVTLVLSAIVMPAAAAPKDMTLSANNNDLGAGNVFTPDPTDGKALVTFDIKGDGGTMLVFVSSSIARPSGSGDRHMLGIRFAGTSGADTGPVGVYNATANVNTSYNYNINNTYSVAAVIDFNAKTSDVYIMAKGIEVGYTKIATDSPFFINGKDINLMTNIRYICSDGAPVWPSGKAHIEDYTYLTASFDTGEGTGTAPASSDRLGGELFKAPAIGDMEAPAGKGFKGWNTESDGTGTFYAPNANIVMPAASTTFYAMWEQMYTITVDTEDGDILVDGGMTEAYAGAVVNVSAVPDSGFVLVDGSLKANGTSIVKGKFVMPYESVTLTAEFVAAPNLMTGVTHVSPGIGTFASSILTPLKTMRPGEEYDLKIYAQDLADLGELRIPLKFDQTKIEILDIELGDALATYGYEEMPILEGEAPDPDESKYVYSSANFDLDDVNDDGLLAFYFINTDLDSSIPAMNPASPTDDNCFVTIKVKALAPTAQITTSVSPIIQESLPGVTGGFTHEMFKYGASITLENGTGPLGDPISFPGLDLTDIKIVAETKIVIDDPVDDDEFLAGDAIPFDVDFGWADPAATYSALVPDPSTWRWVVVTSGAGSFAGNTFNSSPTFSGDAVIRVIANYDNDPDGIDSFGLLSQFGVDTIDGNPYFEVTIKISPLQTIVGRAQIAKKIREGNTTYGYTLPADTDKGIKVELLEGSTVIATTYTGYHYGNTDAGVDAAWKDPNYFRIPMPSGYDITNTSHSYSLRFTRRGTAAVDYSGGAIVVRDEECLVSVVKITIGAGGYTVPGGGEIVLKDGTTGATEYDKFFWLFPGAYASSTAITSGDYNTVKSKLGASTTHSAYGVKYDINEYTGIDGGDLLSVKNSTGKLSTDIDNDTLTDEIILED